MFETCVLPKVVLTPCSHASLANSVREHGWSANSVREHVRAIMDISTFINIKNTCNNTGHPTLHHKRNMVCCKHVFVVDTAQWNTKKGLVAHSFGSWSIRINKVGGHPHEQMSEVKFFDL